MLASQDALMAQQRQALPNPQKRYVSEVLRGGDSARQIRISIAGWHDLYLIVEDDGDYRSDVANWAEAKIITKEGGQIFLDTWEPISAKQDWGVFRRDNRNTVGTRMRIGQKAFDRGLGTHAHSVIHYTNRVDAEWFEAWIGVDASRGKAGSARFVVDKMPPFPKGNSPMLELWNQLARDFPESEAIRQMEWEKADGIWQPDKANGPGELAGRYVQAMRGPAAQQAAMLAGSVQDLTGLLQVRERYYVAKAALEALKEAASFNFTALRLAIKDLQTTCGEKYPRAAEFLTRLDRLQKLAANSDARTMAGEQVISLVAQYRALKREALLANPLLDFSQMLLVRRNPSQLGLPANWQGNSSLPRGVYDNEIALVSPFIKDGRLTSLYKPEGGKFVGDVKLHFEANRLLFSSIGTQNRWQVFEMRLDGSGLRQVTPGDQPDVDNYDACYLPNGALLFCSTAGMVGVPCVNWRDNVARMYRLEADGQTIRQLGFDQDHNWCPTLLNNGRVLYERWEYADLPHAQSRRLFQMNPDGTAQMEYYGSGSYWPNAMFYARAIPGHPTKVVTVISGHHGVPRMGELVILDPAKGRLESSGAVQRIPGYGQKVETIIADQLVNNSWPKFLHPYPLSEKYFIVSAKSASESLWGIYLVDIFDNSLLLVEQAGQALLEPVPIRKTPPPPVIPDKVDPKRKDALVYLLDIYQGPGLRGIPHGAVKQLRILAYDWAYQGMGGLVGTVGLDGPWDVHRILGTVPVKEDGSAYFRVPANTPIAVQPLDAEGKAMQLMRSWFTAMPGEVVSCVGCHEQQNVLPGSSPGSAFAGRGPDEIKPWYGPARGFSFAREVQPVLDRLCVSCHDGQTRYAGKVAPDFRGTERIKDFRMRYASALGGKFTSSYSLLHQYVRKPGIESDLHLLAPMEYHADTTELVQMLRQGHYQVQPDAEAWDRLITWIDLNAPFHGTWHEEIRNPGRQQARRTELRRLYAGMDDDDDAAPPMNRQASRSLPGVAVVQTVHTNSAEACPGWPFDSAEARRRQAVAAKTILRKLDLGQGISIEMVRVPAGEFIMGQANGQADEQPAARVRIDRPFWMSGTETSNEQFAQFDPGHDSHVESKNGYQFGVHGYPLDGPKQPVVRVSWESAQAFCRWLSQKTGTALMLPTEAQWEYACRAGTATPFYYGDESSDFSPFANLADAKLSEFASNPYTVDEPLSNPSPYEDYIPKDKHFNDGGLVSVQVGKYRPNAWGLCDMHGNVWEWTRSSYRPYPYQANDGRNDLSADEKKVVRGGSCRDRPERARAAFRLAYQPWQRVFNVGFRVVCEVRPESGE